jgi:hypothetical protein
MWLLALPHGNLAAQYACVEQHLLLHLLLHRQACCQLQVACVSQIEH